MEVKLSSKRRNQFIDIYSKVEQIVRDSGVKSGECFVFCPHTTAAITINEGVDPDVQDDLLDALERIVPDIEFRHSEGNSDAHLKSSLIGASEVIFFENGKLKLGKWQKIFFCEFDGPRSRRIWVKVTEWT
ncbi:hypothetical protein AKJ54_00945 [candidate division MSBL1 archaeon SCGC-AAA382K21]|uniref:Secondary thiamine-phosphate synthase enzyme n=1 Tax=candidate division MSBL1 archaeon SCGC-AAA382K21 TaxID=1698283 RepID=A0A133VKL9_9EURY|nr:hypothetical protein AKJ54_00945 [candidate division MSBL1 archaeon SCGC-AAA382K21]